MVDKAFLCCHTAYEAVLPIKKDGAGMLFKDTPIIQAPMAGGITTPELVSAVCQAGGIGSFGFAYS